MAGPQIGRKIVTMQTLNTPQMQEPYRDRKRYAWLVSLLVPSIVGIGPLLVMATGDARMLWIQVRSEEHTSELQSRP